MLQRLHSVLSRLRGARSFATPELRALGAVWESQARVDPLWAVLSEPDKRGRAWKLDEFMATGEVSVRTWIERVERAGAQIHFGSALDFGCGVGRLSHALAGRFQRVIGVDILSGPLEASPTEARCGAEPRPSDASIELLRGPAPGRFHAGI
jgi:methylase of polypeptide subunit release factors